MITLIAIATRGSDRQHGAAGAQAEVSRYFGDRPRSATSRPATRRLSSGSGRSRIGTGWCS